jgi:hypothetical protein
MLRVTVTVKGLEGTKTMMRRVDRTLRIGTDKYALAGLRGASTVFAKNFRSEGSMVGGWDQLKARTVKEREEMGLGGTGPILHRYEDLRMLTTTQLGAVRGAATFAKTDFEGGSIRVEVEPKRGSVNVTASGSKAVHQVGRGNMAARPYWFVNGDVLDAARKEARIAIARDLEKL